MTERPPSHKSEAQFRRYEAFIKHIVLNYPKTVRIRPSGVTLNTFVARARDAMKSVLEYKWKTSIDLEKLREIRPSITVYIDDDNVSVRGGPLKSDLVPVSMNDVEVTGSGGSSETFINEDYAFVLDLKKQPDKLGKSLLLSVALLQTSRLLGPIQVINLPDELRQELENNPNFDVAFGELEMENTTVML